MKPYYEDSRVTLYCGDAAEIIPDLSPVTLTITDPPYGNDTKYDIYQDSSENLVRLVDSVVIPSINLAERSLITCGVANIAVYPKPKWILSWVSLACAGSGPWGFCCWQPILAYGKDPYLVNQMGRRPDTISMTGGAAKSEKNGHPCPKPIGLWKKILERGSVNTCDTLFDPFVGGGSTLVAAKELDYHIVGVELSEAYCEVAANRLSQDSLFQNQP